MSNLNINTGNKTFVINGSCELSFNPSDGAFATKLFNAMKEIEKIQTDMWRKGKDAESGEFLPIYESADVEARKVIDDLFGKPVCSAVFGNTSVFALADGAPLWFNLLLAFVDEVDEVFSGEYKATNPRLEKYIAKYQK